MKNLYLYRNFRTSGNTAGETFLVLLEIMYYYGNTETNLVQCNE